MRKLAVVIAAAALAAVAVPGTSNAGGGPTVVTIRGNFTLEPNRYIQLAFRYVPGDVTVNSGSRVMWRERAAFKEPHTVTIVRRSNLPTSIEELDACFGPKGPCSAALRRHGRGKDRKNIVENRNSKRGLDKPRDSRWIGVNDEFTAKITARPGKTLYYLCALHPWMQGSIEVE